MSKSFEVLNAQIKGLVAKLAETEKSRVAFQEEASKWRQDCSEAKRREKEAREQFDDLKARLFAAEQANEFMRGYLARVREDDVVREELVTAGEPGGQEQLVPKRKETQFLRPNHFSIKDQDQWGRVMGYQERQQSARHWITY